MAKHIRMKLIEKFKVWVGILIHIQSTLSKDASGKVPIATNVLRVELDPYLHSKTDFDIVQRDKFYLI